MRSRACALLPIVATACAILVSAAGVAADDDRRGEPDSEPRLRILRADVEQPAAGAAGKILIQGIHFVSRRHAEIAVTLADVALPIIGTPSPTEIVAELPAGYPPGTYRLAVLCWKPGGRMLADKRRDEIDLTIGAGGPPGPKGDAGEPGPPGPAGLASFDLVRGLPCTVAGQPGTIDLHFAADTGVASIRCVAATNPPAPDGTQPLDVVFLVDTTGSMSGEITNLQNQFASLIVPAVRAIAPDTAFAVATFDDFPVAPYGGASGATGDLPFRLVQPLTLDLVAARSALAGLTVHNGGDAPESGTSALYALATGAGLSWPTGGIPGASVGFRPASRRVVVVVTDADFHNDFRDGNPYSFSTPTFADALSALNTIGAKTVAGYCSDGALGDGLANLEAFATGTGAFVGPASFGTTGLCGTGMSGAGRLPDASGRCPLVFICSSSGAGLSTAMAAAIARAAGQ